MGTYGIEHQTSSDICGAFYKSILIKKYTSFIHTSFLTLRSFHPMVHATSSIHLWNQKSLLRINIGYRNYRSIKRKRKKKESSLTVECANLPPPSPPFTLPLALAPSHHRRRRRALPLPSPPVTLPHAAAQLAKLVRWLNWFTPTNLFEPHHSQTYLCFFQYLFRFMFCL